MQNGISALVSHPRPSPWQASPQERAENAFVFGLEDASPDRSLRILYGYVDGPHAPLITEPRILSATTGEVLVDFWRSGIDGHVDAFSANGFRLTARDPFSSQTMTAWIDLNLRSFVLDGDGGQRRPLPTLRALVRSKLSAAQARWQAEHADHSPEIHPSLWTRLRSCLRMGAS